MATWDPRANELFLQARQLRCAHERQAFLHGVCGENATLRSEVEALLEAGERAGSFLERPAVALDPNGTAGWEMTESASAVGTMIGPYKLLEEIGEGGMGLVFVAEQNEPIKRRVALKIIKPGMDSRQVIARFEAERQALAMMDHPHIAKVHDGGTTPEGRPYFVMELVKGTPITDYCDSHRLTTRQRLELFLDVCSAVQHAHQKGIIHRDLKPSNVLVSHHDVTSVVKIIDFGIAKATSGRLTDKTVYTAIAQMVGTPLYMSPEQAGLSDLDVDTRSDVYSLGVVLYELLTGTTPFDSETLKKAGYDEIRRVIREDEPPRPSTRLSTLQQAALSTIAEKRGVEPRRLSQQLRGELDWIVMRALEKDRNRRYESASALAADVQRYLEDEPVQACPPSAGYRFRKFARRYKVALGTAGLVAAALMIGTAVSVWQAVEANAARNLAGERLENEKQARHEAEAHFQKALNAVKRMLMEVGDERVAVIPQMKETRQRLLDDAVAFYTDLIASNPNHSQAYFERGDLYRRVWKAEQSRDDYLKAIECDPNNAEALGELGICLMNLGEKDEIVLPYLQRALELQPTSRRSYLWLTWFYEARRRPKDEAAVYRQAAKLFPPGSAEAYLYLAQACRVVGDFRAAKENLAKCLSLTPSEYYIHSDAYRSLGRVHSAVAEYDQAVAAFSKALDFPRIDADTLLEVYNFRAHVYICQKNFEAAVSDCTKAIELGGPSFFYLNRGKAHFHLKHYEQALADMAKSGELKQNNLSYLSFIPLEDVAACPDEKFRAGLVALADKAIQILDSKPCTSEDTKAAAYYIRAAIYLSTGKLDQADRLLRDLRERLQRGTSKSAEAAGGLALLGNLLLNHQQYLAAEPFLRECLAIREQKQPDDWLRYNALSLLGGALLGQKKHSEAEPLLLQGYEGMKQRETKIPDSYRVVRIAEAAERLVRLYEATNQPEKTRTWREKLPGGKSPGI